MIFCTFEICGVHWLCRHVHLSLRDKNGNNSFAVSNSELKSGRIGAAYDDTKYMSQEGEWFLAGVLDGIADGATNDYRYCHILAHSIPRSSDANGQPHFPSFQMYT